MLFTETNAFSIASKLKLKKACANEKSACNKRIIKAYLLVSSVDLNIFALIFAGKIAVKNKIMFKTEITTVIVNNVMYSFEIKE